MTPKDGNIKATKTLREGNAERRMILSEVLVEHSTVSRTHLKRRLVEDGLLEYMCSTCGIVDWNGSKLSLHLDHINGVYNDNRIENLRLICPNCHSQTSTYAGKKLKGKLYEKETKFCNCGTVINLNSKTCHTRKTKITWPSTEKLRVMVNESSYVAVAKTLGVTDAAVHKRLRTHE